MALTWLEIKARSKAFAEEWKDAHYEKGETQTFYNEFFGIFGLRRKQVATYEQRVKLLSSRHGFIDLFWPGTLLIEQKSAGKNLITAQGQALDYFDALRVDQQPRYILACDFQTFKLLDLETGVEDNFTLAELHEKIEVFSFVLGRQRQFRVQADVDFEAAELMGSLHDQLQISGYIGHDLERLLVRLLFCLFADDTGIFEPKDIFLNLLEEDTKEDGTDTGRALIELFDILDTGVPDRQTNLRSELSQFPYINGGLFDGHIRTPTFNKKMRDTLIEAARFNWTKVSPAIFGSLFQSVMKKEERRKKGAHYTSETNILKVIGPLFMDELRLEFNRINTRKTHRVNRLRQFQEKLGSIKFLDPACGCGNFLVIAYRELRRLELDVLQALRSRSGVIDFEAVQQTDLDIAALSVVTVDQFYGIELEEFPSRIAEVAMWMTDHLANNELSLAFGQSYARIPLTESPHIQHGDALEVDWAKLLPADECNYVMGNPPFIGAKKQSPEQRAQVHRVTGLGGSGGTLDYVAAWFVKAAAYIAGRGTGIGFVATNSICQGEQVAQLWPVLFDRHGLEIAFGHRTFNWKTEARGTAHVHVIIVGLSHRKVEPAVKRLFSYPDPDGDPVETEHRALTAYLFDARTVNNRHLVVVETTTPLTPRTEIVFGNMPNDGGNLILSADERATLITAYPEASPLVRRLLGSKDSISGERRYCLWLKNADPRSLRDILPIAERIKNSAEYRRKSTRPATRKLAEYPGLFGEIRHTEDRFILVPRHSAQRRDYVPFGFYDAENIAHDSCNFIPNATVSDFAILTSKMHMSWLSHIGGRIKSDFRYSIGLVYNTFPWPDLSRTAVVKLGNLGQAVLDARDTWPDLSLETLYDPTFMPPNLRTAHAKLDTAVDRLYRVDPFSSDRDRVEHLFGRYEQLTDPMGSTAATQNRRVSRRRAPATI